MKKRTLILFCICRLLLFTNNLIAQNNPAKSIATNSPALIADTLVMPVSVNYLFSGYGGGWGGQYNLQFDQLRYMPPGDQFYVQVTIWIFSWGTTSTQKYIGSSYNYPLNWYNDSINNAFTDSTNGWVHTSIDLGSAPTSIASISIQFIYVSTTGNQNIYASISNARYDLAPTHFRDVNTIINSGACSNPKDVTFNLNPVCSRCQNGSSSEDMHVSVNFGDGTDTSFTDYSPGQHPGYGIHHTYAFDGVFTPVFNVGNSFGGGTVIRWDEIKVGLDSCDNLSGMVYVDVNGNCAFDAGEPPASNVPVTVVPGTGPPNYTIFTDSIGNYSLGLQQGTYQVNGHTYYYNPVCPPNYNLLALPSTGNDFGLDSICFANKNVYTVLSASPFRPGRKSYVSLFAGQDWCANTNNSIVKLILPPGVTYDISTIPPTSIAGDTLIWTGVVLNTFTTFSTQITLLGDTTLQFGDSLCLTAFVDSLPNELNISDNTFTVCREVRTSFDPNAKEVAYTTVNTDGTVPHASNIYYNIRFQNKGNDYAHNVFILDTLDASLDLASIKILGASHPYKVEIISGNVLKIRFDKIMLPDSLSNETLSHGYFSYSIKAISSIANYTNITNKAYIYFDYNRPIKTNSTLTIIKTITTGISEATGLGYFTVYPNPASNVVFINAVSGQPVFIYNMYGALIDRIENEKGEIIEYKVSTLAKGFYLIRSGSLRVKLVKK